MKKDGIVNWGVISTARIGVRTVIPAMQNVDGMRLMGICSRDTERASSVAREMEIPRHYGSYEEMLADPDIHVVYNPLPNGMHHDWVIKSAEAGKHSLCEKPMADNVEQAIAMNRASAQNGVLLMEAFMWRFGNRVQRVRQLVREGVIGELRLVRAAFSFPLPRDPNNIRFQQTLSGGALEDAGCYAVSATRFFMEDEPISVEARLRIDPEFRVNTSGMASLIYPEDRMALVDFSFEQEGRQLLEIVGTKGRIAVEEFLIPRTNETEIHITKNRKTTVETFPPVNTYTLQAEAMNRAVQRLEELPWDGDDAIRQVRVLDAIRQSHQTGARVELELHHSVS